MSAQDFNRLLKSNWLPKRTCFRSEREKIAWAVVRERPVSTK